METVSAAETVRITVTLPNCKTPPFRRQQDQTHHDSRLNQNDRISQGLARQSHALDRWSRAYHQLGFSEHAREGSEEGEHGEEKRERK